MLEILRRVFDFSDWSVNHPTDPPPGDMLDASFDAQNNKIAEIIALIEGLQRSDGALANGIVTRDSLSPELYGDLRSELRNAVQELTDKAQIAHSDADIARHAAEDAAEEAKTAALEISAIGAELLGTRTAAIAALAALVEKADIALQEAKKAQQAADNLANDEARAQAIAMDWAYASHEWAEHMPDTVPPNILIDMGITGDHWSSRWWANRAQLIVDEGRQDTICDLQQYWYGAANAPPVLTMCGDPLGPGAAYWDTSDLKVRVYDGVYWHDMIEPVPGAIDRYLYLPTIDQTVIRGADSLGNVLVCDPTAFDVAELHLNGVKLIEVDDYAMGADEIVLNEAIRAPHTLEITILRENDPVQQSIGVKINTDLWVFNGITRVFDMVDGTGAPVEPAGPIDVQIVLANVRLEPGEDYTVSGSQFNFLMTPPQAGTDVWAIAGLATGSTASGIVFIGPTPPIGVANGSLWSPTNGDLYVFDAGLSVWVQLAGLSL